MSWHWDHSYAEQLPALFHREAQPSAFSTPQLVMLNEALADELGLEFLKNSPEQTAAWLTGQTLPEGARPIAQAYAGHQFGHFTALGDGRAILLGETITPAGQRYDLQLKGGGCTPFSRRGDGLAALGPMLREYLISEAMHALGVPTTRSLAVVSTGLPVYREEVLRGAVLTRVAASHIRVGTFEWAAAHQDHDALSALADYTQQRHYPEITASGREKYLALFAAILERQASLIAQWQSLGFIHGVMNTDNMALSGETIDYGPCAFMDQYDPETVFSSIDRDGRYAYENQPPIAQWNLARLAEAMIPLFHEKQATALELAQEVLETFSERFNHYWLEKMRAKLGLFTAEESDHALVKKTFQLMQVLGLDFTQTFRSLPKHLTQPLRDGDMYHDWHQEWLARLNRQPQSHAEATALMQKNNPAVIPRNHRVEAALTAATKASDLQPFYDLLQALKRPYDTDLETDVLAQRPPSNWKNYRTFCGT
jgi:serine/tyrosine/threonine adenylyltransferase